MLDEIYTTGGPAAKPLTAADVLAMMAKLRDLPRPEFDSLVCLPSGLELLRRYCTEAPCVPRDALGGIPVYAAADVNDALRIVTDLKARGKRIRVLAGPGDPFFPELEGVTAAPAAPPSEMLPGL